MAVRIAGALLLLSVAAAALPPSTAERTYPVPFYEWVAVYLAATCSRAEDSASITVTPAAASGETLFVVRLTYLNTPAGRRVLDEHWPRVRKAVGEQCRRWTEQGFSIQAGRDIVFEAVLGSQR